MRNWHSDYDRFAPNSFTRLRPGGMFQENQQKGGNRLSSDCSKRLEPLTKQHASKLFAGLSSPKLYQYVPQTPPDSISELEMRYGDLEKRTSPDGTNLWLNWACRLIASDIYIGLVQVTLDLDSIDAALAYFIFSDFQHLGYGREACEAVLEHIFRDYEAVSSSAEIDDLNEASIALAHRLGFQKSGDSKRWHLIEVNPTQKVNIRFHASSGSVVPLNDTACGARDEKSLAALRWSLVARDEKRSAQFFFAYQRSNGPE